MFSYGNGFESRIPMQFRARTLAAKHAFGVWRPWGKEVQILLTKSKELEVVPPSAFCGINDDGNISPLVIEAEKYPRQASAIFQLGRVIHTGPRAMRYINLYKVYEVLCPAPDIRYAAIRHALAHATHALNRRKTVDALITAFGNKEIDLSLHRHERIFWQRFGELLVLVDSLLRAELEIIRSSSLFLAEHIDVLTLSLAEYYFPEQLQDLRSNSSFKNPLRGLA